MATSSSTDYSVSRDVIIAGALRVLGVVAQGESPTATQVTEAAEALNMLAKAWEADGMPLWAMKEYSIPMTTGAASYRIGLTQTVDIPKPLRIVNAYFHNGASNVDVPMISLTRQKYNMLGNKASTGQPIQYYYDPQRVYGDLFLYPVPDATASAATNWVRIIYQRPFEDFDASTDEPDFPQEWFQALKFGLAEVLAPEYGVPLEHYGHLRKVAKEYKDQALGFGTEEGSMFFSADRRNW